MQSAKRASSIALIVGTITAVSVGALTQQLASAQASDVTPPPIVEPVPPSTDAPVSTWPSSVTVGKSVKGRTITAVRQGNPSASKILLAVGIIHGNEKAGRRIVDEVRKTPVPETGDVQIWTIRSMNPDGAAKTNRYNARKVDLNRNFPTDWSRKTVGAGKGPASEPETKALVSFMSKLRPDATLIYHQDWNVVLGACNTKTRPYALRYAALTGLKKESCRRASYTGTMGSWFNSNFPGYLLTVELPGTRKVTAKKVTRWRNSVLTTSRELTESEPTPVVPDVEPDPEPEPTLTPEPLSRR
ncbi:MAG: M14 family zinc carboxypeptidase [Candidatus Nanopelagicales bacterium]